MVRDKEAKVCGNCPKWEPTKQQALNFSVVRSGPCGAGIRHWDQDEHRTACDAFDGFKKEAESQKKSK